MRAKLQDATAPAKSIRTSAGGLYDIDFLSSFLLVKKEIHPKTGSLRDRLWRCSAKGALEKRDAALLDHAAELCRTVEHVLRLVTGRNGRWLPSAEHARQRGRKTRLANSAPRIFRRSGTRAAAHLRRSAEHLRPRREVTSKTACEPDRVAT